MSILNFSLSLLSLSSLFSPSLCVSFLEQANGHIESAISGYRQIWQNCDGSKADQLFRETITDQLIINLANAHDWSELQNVLRIEEERDQIRLTIPLHSLKSKQIEHFIKYEQTKDLAVLDAGDWDTIASDATAACNDFSSHRLISLTENTVCCMSMMQKMDVTRYDSELMNICSKIAQSGLQECLRTRSREHLNTLVILNHIVQKVSQRFNGETSNGNSLRVDKSFGSTILTQLLMWSEFFDNKSEMGQQINLDFRLDACSMTRKEGNLSLCRKQLEIFFKSINFAEKIGCSIAESSLEHIGNRLIADASEPDIRSNIWNRNTARSVYEMAKWLYSYPDKKETAIQFAAANTISIQRSLEFNEDPTDQLMIVQRIARSYLTLSEWLQSENDQFLAASSQKPLGKLIETMDNVRLRNGGFEYETAEVKTIMGPIDLAIGKLLSRSVQQCPDLSKTYGAYGNWCYRWGRKIVEHRAEKDVKAGLRSSDMKSIKDLLPLANNDDIEQILNVLDLHKVSAEDEELVSSSDEITSTELIKTQLSELKVLSTCSIEVLLKIIEIWRLANRDTYSFYEMAAECYFKYLQLATQSQDDALANVSNTADDGKSTENCSIVTATLRILRLIVKHALGLQEVLEAGLETTPTSPWKVIISHFSYFSMEI